MWVLGRRRGRSRSNHPGEQEPGAPAPQGQRAPRDTGNPCRPWPSFPPRVRRGLASCLQQHDRSLGPPPRPVELGLPPSGTWGWADLPGPSHKVIKRAHSRTCAKRFERSSPVCETRCPCVWVSGHVSVSDPGASASGTLGLNEMRCCPVRAHNKTPVGPPSSPPPHFLSS